MRGGYGEAKYTLNRRGEEGGTAAVEGGRFGHENNIATSRQTGVGRVANRFKNGLLLKNKIQNGGERCTEIRNED